MPDDKPGRVFRGPFGGWYFTSNFRKTEHGFVAVTKHPILNSADLEDLYQSANGGTNE